MKNLALLLLLLSTQFGSAQTIHSEFTSINDSLSHTESTQFLAQDAIRQYQSDDKKTYYENLYKLQIVARQYNRVKSTIKKFAFEAYHDSIETADIALPYRLYAETMIEKPKTKAEFDTIFVRKFRSEYAKISPKYQAYALQYFLSDDNFSGEPLRKLWAELSAKEKWTPKDNLDYCLAYSKCAVASALKNAGVRETEKIESRLYFKEDRLLNMPDGGTVPVLVYRDKKSSGPQPAVMLYNIYAGRDEARCKEMVAHGYIGIVADTRGKRTSLNDLEPYEHDAADAYEIIDWISKQPWSNGKVGMFGGSYLGFSQWSAVKKVHPALKTIVPQVAVGAGIDFPNDCGIFMGFALKWIRYVSNSKLTDNAVRNDDETWNAIYGSYYKSGVSFRSLDSIYGKKDVIFQRWLSHPTYDSYWQDMAPQKQEFAKIDIPILTTTGYYDDDQRGAMYYYNEYQKWNTSGNYYLVIGPYDHGGAQGYPLRNLGEYEIDEKANIPISQLVFDWFDYILKGGKKPEILQDKVNFEVMGKNEWKHVPTLGAMHNDLSVLYLGDKTDDGNYKLSKSVAKEKFILQTVDMADRNTIPLDDSDEIVGGIGKLTMTEPFRKNPQLCFVSDAVTEPFAISGAISIDLDFSINKKDVDLLVDLYQQRPDGTYLFLNQQRQRASLSADKTKRQLLKPGKKQHIAIDNSFITSCQFEKGSKIVVLVGVLKSPNWQINYGSGKDVSDETIRDAGDPMQIKWFNTSKITIPVLR